METERILVRLDKSWELNDFAAFAKEYVDLYSFFYTLYSVGTDVRSPPTFTSYPWEGGYSVVNFFRKTYGLIRKPHRLKILKIQYSSPGVIELSGILSVAKEISFLVGTICASAYTINKTYHVIKSGYINRKLAKLKLKEMEAKLSRDDINFIYESVRQLAIDFNFNPTQIKALTKITKGNELIQLKILLALYRRAELISKQQIDGKITT